jgi:hypothetical protein
VDRIPIWLWPNVLSLDAPVIAVIWQTFLARCYAVPLRAPAQVALGLAVWAIYLGDRLLDARRPAPGGEAARHAFYRRHERAATALLWAALLAGVLVSLGWLRPAVIHNAVIPFAAVLVYLGFVHLTGARVAKEPVVAFIFTAGTFLAAWTNDPASPLTLLFPAAGFFLLCLANLAAIESWEWRELRRLGDAPHPVTRALIRGSRVWAPALAAAAGIFGRNAWYYAIAASALAITILIFAGRRVPIELRRVLVDASLLSPLLFWI